MSILRGRGLREAVVVMRESQGGRRTRMGDCCWSPRSKHGTARGGDFLGPPGPEGSLRMTAREKRGPCHASARKPPLPTT